MNICAVIPARGGSKSIPKKNIKLLRGKPLIQYSIAMGGGGTAKGFKKEDGVQFLGTKVKQFSC